MCLIATYTSSQNVQTFTLILDLNPTVNFVIFILCSQRNFRLLIWLLSSLDTTAKAQEGEQKYSRPRTAWLRANTLSDLPRSPGQSKSISQMQYRGEGTCTLLFEEGGFQSHGAKGLERNATCLMGPATWPQKPQWPPEQPWHFWTFTLLSWLSSLSHKFTYFLCLLVYIFSRKILTGSTWLIVGSSWDCHCFLLAILLVPSPLATAGGNFSLRYILQPFQDFKCIQIGSLYSVSQLLTDHLAIARKCLNNVVILLKEWMMSMATH